jgi:hypothetical protein
MNEHSYIKSVHRHLNELSLRWKINDAFTGGVPDCFYEGSHQDLFVEYKYIKPFPKKEHTVIDLTDSRNYLTKQQQLWLTRRHNCRKDAWVIAGSEYGGVIFRGLGWQQPFSAEEFKRRALPQRLIAEQIQAVTNGRE